MAKTPPHPNDSDDDLLVSLSAGDTIFVEGEAGDDMYIVESGEVEIVKSFGLNERQLAVLGPGDFFGEIAILEEIPRMATARALNDCRLLPIDPSTFDHLLRDHPEITVRVLRKLSRRLREIEEGNQRAHEAAAGVFAGISRDQLEPVNPHQLKQEAAPRAKPTESRTPDAFSTSKVVPAAEMLADKDHLENTTSEAVLPEPRPRRSTKVNAHLLHEKTSSSFPVAQGPKNLVGRFDPVTGKYPEIDLQTLDTERSLSRRHARIWSQNNRFYLREEVGVGNGTFLGGKRLAAGEDYEIKDQDHLRFGLVELTFRVND